jgi:hypothetical protein
VSEWKTDEYGREHPVEHTGRPKKMYHVTEEYSRWEQYENLVSLKAETA